LICCEWAYRPTLTLLRLCRSGVDFRKIGVWLSPSDVAISWLRLPTPMDCISHPFYIYTKCFNTLICCEWAWVHHYTVTPVQVRGGFLDNWGMAKPEDVAMSWLRLQTPADCIPHPNHMYTKCFSTLICCGWAYGCTLTLLRLCRSGVDFWENGVDLSPGDVAMSWLRLQTPVDCILHP
jgi:hypothetical protein